MSRRVPRANGGEHTPVVLPSSGNPMVVFRLVFSFGSAHDPVGMEGLSAVAAALLAEGGTEALSRSEVLERLYPMAGQVSAQVDKEVTTFVGRVHRDHLEEFYCLFRDLLLRPRFDVQDFARYRTRLRLHLTQSLRGDDDEELGKQALQWMIYSGHPYRHPAQGTVAGLDAITLDDVKSFYRRWLTFDSMWIGLAGDLPRGFASRMQTDFRSALPARGTERPDLHQIGRRHGMEVLIVEKPAQATAISLGFPLDVTRSDPDFYPLLVANTYLGDHRTFNGVLMNEIRSKRGLNYGDYSYIENFIQDRETPYPVPNILRRQQFASLWLRPVAPANAHFALRAAIRQLRKLCEEGPGQEAFAATRNYLINYSKLWVQSLDRRLGYLMDSELCGTGFYIDEIERRLRQIHLDDVRAAIGKHLDRWDIRVAMVARDAAHLAAGLRDNHPSPPAYESPGTPQDVLREDEEIECYPLPIRETSVLPVEEIFER